MNKDYIILIHQYAYEHLLDGATTQEVKDFLAIKGVATNETRLANTIEDVFGQVFVHGYKPTMGYTKGEARYYMLSEAYYRYIEYIELLEARKNSKIATWLAVIALFATAFFSLLQLIIRQ